MKLRERDIEKFFVATVRTMGGKAYKFSSPNNRGVPDRIVFFPQGIIVLAELKAPGKHPTPLQLKVIRDLRALGTEVYVIDSMEKVRIFKEGMQEVLDDILDK